MRDREKRYRATAKGRATRARHKRRWYVSLSPLERALLGQQKNVNRRKLRIAFRKELDVVSD